MRFYRLQNNGHALEYFLEVANVIKELPQFDSSICFIALVVVRSEFWKCPYRKFPKYVRQNPRWFVVA